MFIGSINRYMRAVLETAAGQWKGLPVYIACSGNFTVERILAKCGVGAIHSNDVSIYSCALGWHLAGQAVQYRVKETAPAAAWLGDYLSPGPATIATLLLAGEMVKAGGDLLVEAKNPYAARMRDEYRRRWPEMHAKTVERVERAIGSFRVASYFAGDCRQFLAAADKGAVCISFPPTYKGGYERLFKRLDAIFDWPVPSYQLFAPEDFDAFSQTVRSFRHWMISSDTPQEALAGQHVATVQTSLLSKPVFMYSDGAPHRLATARQNVGHNHWAPRTDEAVEPIQVTRIDAKVMNAKLRQAVLHSEAFQSLWNRIKHKTTYRVQFDNEKLLADCTKALAECPPVSRTRVQIRKADLAIGRGGVLTDETAAAAPIALDETDIDLPDVLTDLQDKTQLTRRSLVRVLTDSGRLDDFKQNPQQFIELATEAINRTKRMALVDGIKYQRLGDQYYYCQELFENEELTGYLKNMLASEKSVYEQVVYDSSTIERPFAEALEKNEAVKVYAKLPGWFKVPTPLGTYNPDWAVLVEKDGAERVYFVVETKGSLSLDDLRGQEGAKIKCGKAHFQALSVGDNPAKFIPARNIDDLMAQC